MARKATGKKGAKPKGLPKGLARVLADRKVSADSEALLADLIEIWGGTRQLAIDIHAEFQKAAAGGMTRQRILEMLQRLVINNTNNEIGRVIRPSDLSDAELEAEAMKYAERVIGHAAPESAPPAA